MPTSLSIIIPFFDHKEQVAYTLDSIYSQSVSPKEVIIVNDDPFSTLENIKGYDNLIIINNKVNVGPSGARNLGKSLATGEILLFLDADVVLNDKNHLEKILNAFNFNPDIDALTGTYAPGSFYPNFLSYYKNLYMEYFTEEQDDRVNYLLGGICAIRSSVEFNWNENLRIAEDTYLGQRLTDQGLKIAFLRDLRVEHRKNYNLYSFTKHSFIVSFYFSLILLKRKAWGKYNSGSFSHTSKRQLLSLLSVAFTLLYPPIFLFFLLINWPYLSFIAKKTDITATILATLITFYDNVIKGFGIVFALFVFFTRKGHPLDFVQDQ